MVMLCTLYTPIWSGAAHWPAHPFPPLAPPPSVGVGLPHPTLTSLGIRTNQMLAADPGVGKGGGGREEVEHEREKTQLCHT